MRGLGIDAGLDTGRKGLKMRFLYCFLFGFLLAVGILEGLIREGERIYQGHDEKTAILYTAGKIK